MTNNCTKENSENQTIKAFTKFFDLDRICGRSDDDHRLVYFQRGNTENISPYDTYNSRTSRLFGHRGKNLKSKLIYFYEFYEHIVVCIHTL